MWTSIAGVLGAIGVALGAFGAHGLEGRLAASKLDAWNTGVDYHLLHAVALLSLALYARATGRPVALPAAAFSAGILLFSGSLYGLALDGPRWLGPVTPVGGLCFIVGWLSLAALSLAKSPTPD